MTRFTVSDTLFGESSIFYMDPLAGKQKTRICNPVDIEAHKDLIRKKLMREIASHLYFNRSKAYDFLTKSNPHHITPAFRHAITRLRVNLSNMYSHEEMKELASHISIHIIPDLLSDKVAPKQDKPEGKRYHSLAEELENLTHEILNSDIRKLTAEMGTEKTAQLAL